MKSARLTWAPQELLARVLRVLKIDPLISKTQSRLLRTAFATAIEDAAHDETAAAPLRKAAGDEGDRGSAAANRRRWAADARAPDLARQMRTEVGSLRREPSVGLALIAGSGSQSTSVRGASGAVFQIGQHRRAPTRRHQPARRQPVEQRYAVVPRELDRLIRQPVIAGQAQRSDQQGAVGAGRLAAARADGRSPGSERMTHRA